MRTIRCFITDFLVQSGNEPLIEQFDMADFDVPVLDYRRTLTEKVVSLIRCSLADAYIPQMNAKIRHFYDLHHLLQDEECNKYLHSDAFRTDFQQLFEHDRKSFAKPDGWLNRSLEDSPLITDLHATWNQLQLTYLRELPDLAYRDIPPADRIEQSMEQLLSYINL